jgi:phosphohistidine phosphatase
VIWLLRHGDAEDGSPDEARRLTAKGRRQAECAGRALAALGVRLDACISSPRARAFETAQIACEQLGLDVETAPELGGGAFDAHELAAGRQNVMLVGHEPDFSNAVARLTGARVEMKKGGLAAIDEGRLVRLMRPDELRLLAG